MFQYDNRFTSELPADPESKNFCRQVHGACFSRVLPTAVAAPQLVASSREMADELGLAENDCQADWFVQAFSGNQVLPGMDPFAMCYGGHQFGHWAGQLGDGRAINLCEVQGKNSRWTLQLKGAGKTPYSRTADGLAVLRSSLREFVCSEAMYHLGVPTTRALSLILSGEEVMRDMFYDGRPQWEPGAIVCRVAPSFIRFGNFEILAARQDEPLLRQFTKFSIKYDFPEFWASRTDHDSPEFYAEWFAEVCRRTAEMMAHWMRVGFVHGVMNTDNMSILGLTIDYGPYGWLEDYDPNWTPNTTDAQGRRYAFGQQPQIGLWNLVRLANAIYSLVGNKDLLQTALGQYSETYERRFQEMMAAKLGIEAFDSVEDAELLEGLFQMLGQTETDFSIFFRRLGQFQAEASSRMSTTTPESEDRLSTDSLLPEGLVDSQGVPMALREAYYDLDSWTPTVRDSVHHWLARYLKRLSRDEKTPEQRRQTMNQVNPKFVFRNYLAQIAIDAATAGDYSVVQQMLEVLRHPYDDQPEFEQWSEKRPEWAKQRAGCSMLSCSS